MLDVNIKDWKLNAMITGHAKGKDIIKRLDFLLIIVFFMFSGCTSASGHLNATLESSHTPAATNTGFPTSTQQKEDTKTSEPPTPTPSQAPVEAEPTMTWSGSLY